MVMRTTLSKKEFAAALGMKENDLFVQKMFNIVDKDGDNRISFQVRLIEWIMQGRRDVRSGRTVGAYNSVKGCVNLPTSCT